MAGEEKTAGTRKRAGTWKRAGTGKRAGTWKRAGTCASINGALSDVTLLRMLEKSRLQW